MKFFKYLFILSTFSLQAQTFDMDTVYYKGDDKINIVFLSDGYTANQLDTFINDVKFLTGELFKISPYNNYKNYFNIIAIKVPSLESGAKHKGGLGDCPSGMPIINPHNYFGSSFDNTVHRALQTNYDTTMTVLAKNFPNYDIIIMLVNTPYYGGTGGSICVFGNSPNPATMAHELGHTFGSLADEYYEASTFHSGEYPNQTAESNPTKVKWKSWIFAGSGISLKSIAPKYYIPSNSCKMSNSSLDYCSVCKQEIVENIHNLVDPVTDMHPAENTTNVVDSALLFTFTATQTIPNSLKSIWKLDSTIIDKHLFSDSLILHKKTLPSGYHYLTVSVQDTITYSRFHLIYPSIHQTTIKWILQINKDQNTIIDKPYFYKTDISVFPNPAGNKNELNYRFVSPEDKLLKIILSDLNGKIVLENDQLNGTIDISGLQNGFYVVSFITNENKTDLKLQILR